MGKSGPILLPELLPQVTMIYRKRMGGMMKLVCRRCGFSYPVQIGLDGKPAGQVDPASAIAILLD